MALGTATGDQTVQVLQEWFGVLPIPECILSDNGSYFTATVAQDWAQGEGIKGCFTPHITPKLMV